MEALNGETERLKKEVCLAVRQLFERGLIFPHGGNVSARLPGSSEYWITSNVYKGWIQPQDLVKMNLKGEVLEAREGVKPSIEYPMHQAVYERREDVNAVVHSHSPVTTGLTLAGVELQPITAEAGLLLKKVKTVPFAPPGSQVLAEKAAKQAEGGTLALLLQGHGVVGLGRNVLEAVGVVETLEGLALTQFFAMLAAGRVPTIPVEALKDLEGVE
ncbi:MAG: class II aldolase/adducin family protein [Candidatus Hecatellales archaeon B24]|nr:MAG: class II aldolase/adducin family protein [Candidatus Hecatellales archaeon B24]